MSLYNEWENLLKNQTDSTVDKFWKEYSEGEMKIYTWILENQDQHLSGTIKELAEKFNVREVIFTGFLDGVKTSLRDENSLDPESVTGDTTIDLELNFPILYQNMLKADAEHLYSLPAWDNVLTEEKRAEITKEFKRSRTYHAPKKIGRNDPCPCGSGKKYKNCCGRKNK